jgi:hypothetical protein
MSECKAAWWVMVRWGKRQRVVGRRCVAKAIKDGLCVVHQVGSQPTTQEIAAWQRAADWAKLAREAQPRR